jgi:hypothetical protein
MCLKGEYPSSSGVLTREVYVVARCSSGVLTRGFRKLDRGTRLKAVQVQQRGKFRDATFESSSALTREVQVGRNFGKFKCSNEVV